MAVIDVPNFPGMPVGWGPTEFSSPPGAEAVDAYDRSFWNLGGLSNILQRVQDIYTGNDPVYYVAPWGGDAAIFRKDTGAFVKQLNIKTSTLLRIIGAGLKLCIAFATGYGFGQFATASYWGAGTSALSGSWGSAVGQFVAGSTLPAIPGYLMGVHAKKFNDSVLGLATVAFGWGVAVGGTTRHWTELGKAAKKVISAAGKALQRIPAPPGHGVLKFFTGYASLRDWGNLITAPGRWMSGIPAPF